MESQVTTVQVFQQVVERGSCSCPHPSWELLIALSIVVTLRMLMSVLLCTC